MLTKTYIKQEVKVRDLKDQPSYRLLPDHDDNEELVLGDWHAGVFTILPGTACGSQPIEAFHQSWQRHMQSGRGGAPLVAVSNLQAFMRMFITSSEPFDGRAVSVIRKTGGLVAYLILR
jgi:hypothetical protein